MYFAGHHRHVQIAQPCAVLSSLYSSSSVCVTASEAAAFDNPALGRSLLTACVVRALRLDVGCVV